MTGSSRTASIVAEEAGQKTDLRLDLAAAKRRIEQPVESMRQQAIRIECLTAPIVYRKDSGRRGTYGEISFTFRGYTFRPRNAYDQRTGEVFTGFLQAVAPVASSSVAPSVPVLGSQRATPFQDQGVRKLLVPRSRGRRRRLCCRCRRAPSRTADHSRHCSRISATRH